MSKREPIFNAEKLAIERAISKGQRTLEEYIIERLDHLERTVTQQKVLIDLLEKQIKVYKERLGEQE